MGKAFCKAAHTERDTGLRGPQAPAAGLFPFLPKAFDLSSFMAHLRNGNLRAVRRKTQHIIRTSVVTISRRALMLDLRKAGPGQKAGPAQAKT
jgi:hypothetical protein